MINTHSTAAGELVRPQLCISRHTHRGRQTARHTRCESADSDSAQRSTPIASTTKRQLLQGLAATPILFAAPPSRAAEQKPGEPQKLKNLPIAEVCEKLRRGLEDDQYYVSGKVPKAIFADDCVFSDPTQTTHGIYWYSKAVPALFNPEKSKVEIISLKVRDEKTIDLRWRLEAQLNVPALRYNFKPYCGSTVYTTNKDGLINQQKESWDIGIIDAFVSTFVPSYGAPPAPPIEELRRRENQTA